MRKRLEDRIRKALRIASALEPQFVRECLNLEPSSGGLLAFLSGIVANRTRPAHERVKAAELMTVARVRGAFEPILDHFLECDASTAWDIVTALPHWLPRFPPKPERILRILKHDPDPERRAATVEFLGRFRVPGRRRFLVSVFEDDRRNGVRARPSG